VAPFK